MIDIGDVRPELVVAQYVEEGEVSSKQQNSPRRLMPDERVHDAV